jgi:hypothetical protein
LLNPDFRDMLLALRDEDVEYLLVGSYALAAYGRARATEDIDLWVNPTKENASRVMNALVRFGAPTSRLSAADFEADDVVYQMGNPPWRIDILTSIDGVTFAEAWQDRQEYSIDDLKIPVLSRRHLIANSAP